MKTARSVSFALLCPLLAASVSAAPPNPAAPGMDAAKLKEIPKRM